MRKLMLICLFAITALTASAQKFALLDMEYILKNIPAYERANEQLNQVSKNGRPKLRRSTPRLQRSTRTTRMRWCSFRQNRRKTARRQ